MEVHSCNKADTTIQLLECCNTKLRCDVTRNCAGPVPLENFTEENLLKAIRALALGEGEGIVIKEIITDKNSSTNAFFL